MAGEPTVTVIGRLGADPELRFTNEGKPVSNFSVGCTPSVRVNNEWQNKETLWFRVSLWRNAEDFVETATKGTLVVATGRFSVRTYETKDGEKRTEMVLDADGVGIMPATKSVKAVTEDVPW